MKRQKKYTVGQCYTVLHPVMGTCFLMLRVETVKGDREALLMPSAADVLQKQGTQFRHYGAGERGWNPTSVARAFGCDESCLPLTDEDLQQYPEGGTWYSSVMLKSVDPKSTPWQKDPVKGFRLSVHVLHSSTGATLKFSTKWRETAPQAMYDCINNMQSSHPGLFYPMQLPLSSSEEQGYDEG